MSNESPIQRLTKRIEEVSRDSIESLKDDPYVKMAFQRANLDLETTEDHTLLMRAFCRVLQGAIPLKPAGFLNNLILDAEKIVASENLTGGRREAVERLRVGSPYRQKYEKYSVHTLLKYMKDACNRNKNPEYDELAKGRPKRKMYSRTIFAPMELPPDSPPIGLLQDSPPTGSPQDNPPIGLPQDRLQGNKPAQKKKRIGERPVLHPASVHPKLAWFEGRVYIVEIM